MAEPIIISACGYIDGTGFGGRSAAQSLAFQHDVSRGGFERNLRWRMVSQAPYDRFGRMDLLCKFAAVAVEMLHLAPPEGDLLRHEMAVVLGTAAGCHSVDCDFYGGIAAGGGAGPTLFAYTLPSIATGEIAIRHQIGGPTCCFMAGEESGLLALWEGIELLESEEGVGSCICLSADVCSKEARAMAEGAAFLQDMKNHAYAFLVEERDYATRNARLPLAEVSGRPASGVAAGSDARPLIKEVATLCEFLMDREAGMGEGRLQLASPAALGMDRILDVVRCKTGK